MGKYVYNEDGIVMFNTEKAACDFGDWLVHQGYLDYEDVLTDNQLLIDDFQKAYEVAPRLIHLLTDISDN